MIFLETSFNINLHVTKVQNHEKAIKLYENIEKEPKCISEMTIYETLTVLRKLKQPDNKIKEIYDFLANSKIITVFEDLYLYQKALDYTLNKNKIGFFDNLSYMVMKENNIKTIASFDPDFDIFQDIKRIG
ncbi:MAG: type II toxin-antitoxin system VapC family toxin [Methanobrevibacter sp.]|nr:type II toxin-antitoxin system VapC family toxin [Methanobrevibacter sp.]